MNFQAKRRVGILLMVVSLVFIIATAYTLSLHTDEGNHNEAPPAEGNHSWTAPNEGSEEKRPSFTNDPREMSIFPEGAESGGTGLESPHPKP